MVIRVAITPITGLTIGAAYDWAPIWMTSPSLPLPIDVNAYKQRAAELDFEFSHGHAMVSGEVVYNIWPVRSSQVIAISRCSGIISKGNTL